MITKIIKKNWLIILILLLAAFLRLYRIDGYMEFLGDQGRDVIIIRDFLKNGNFFFIGPQTSIGNMYLGPFYYYLIAPALLLANLNPIGPAIFIALLGILTVWLMFFICSKWFDSKVGLIAAFLYTISPVTIKYSNFSWNPNIMPLFALLFIYFIVEGCLKNKYSYFFWASVSFVLALNSHFLALILLPIGGLVWLMHLIYLAKNKHKNFKSFLQNTIFAILIFLVSLVPQILFDLKHNGQNIRAIIDFFQYRETTVNIKPYKAIPEILPIFSQISTNLIINKDNSSASIILSVLFILILAIFSYFNFKKFKENKSKYFLVLVLWLVIGLLGLGLYKQHLYNHYFGFLFPVIYILIGIIISYILSFANLISKIIGFLILILIAFFSFQNNPFLYKPNNQLAHAKNIAQAISNHYQDSDGKYNIVLLPSYNDYRGFAPRYFLINNFPSVNLLNMEKYEQAQTLFVILDDPSKWPKGVNSDVWEINTFGNKKIIEEFTTSDKTKIVKIIKAPNENKK